MLQKQIINLLYTIYSAGFNHGVEENELIPEHTPFDAFNRLIIGESPMQDGVYYAIKDKVDKLLALGISDKNKALKEDSIEPEKIDNLESSDNEKFSVSCYALHDIKDADKWVHWSEGLRMLITKGGVTIKLQEGEIEQLVKTLPRTFGNSY